METSKYYTPFLEEFHVGFEYEYKSTFLDGTVKTKEQFEANPWNKGVIKSLYDLVYVERVLNGANFKNSLSGIRVKYIDKEDIESLGFILINEEVKSYSQWCHFKNKEVELHVQLNKKYFPRLLNIGSLSRGKFIGNFKKLTSQNDTTPSAK